jgi:hypothetical protein
MKMSFRRFLSRFRLARRRTLEPSYYLIDNQPRHRRGFGHLKMLGTAVTSILGTLLVTNQLYQGTKTAGVELELHRTYSGFEVRAINRGGATATAVDLKLATWPHGAPARWVQSYSLANIPPRSERALLVDMVPASWPAESRPDARTDGAVADLCLHRGQLRLLLPPQNLCVLDSRLAYRCLRTALSQSPHDGLAHDRGARHRPQAPDRRVR